MDLERKLYNLGMPIGGRAFVIGVVLLSVALVLLGHAFFPSYAWVGIVTIPLALLLIDYLHDRYVTSVEAELPRFVHFLSTHPHPTLKEVLRMGASGFGNLSKELKSAVTMVKGGLSASRALLSIAQRLDSPLLKRTFEGITLAFRTGNIQEFLKNLSEELYFVHELENERRSSLSLQRYSILISSVVLVPFILGVVLSVVERLGEVPPLFYWVIPLYLGMLASIGGLFLAWTEAKPKNAPFYILLGIIGSIGIYTVVLWLY